MAQAYCLKAENLFFDYNSKTKIFNNHSLDLSILKTEKNKLFGIIGPSGTGKTTFVSIIGGQLKPTKGKVLIDGKDIYSITDDGRRQLICLQMQTSTSLRGKLKYNLLFGLPQFTDDGSEVEKEIYSDQELIKVLKNVGLWSIFKDKEGLDTLIGEGGLNLSGGQRQRLNFAGLYLRSNYYKPSLILIDEPTSSLDEISEKAITKMIEELSSMALTLVVAHRLKTLEEAKAIFDTSLLERNNKIEFLTRDELLKKSKYYQDLLSGNATLDTDFE